MPPSAFLVAPLLLVVALLAGGCDPDAGSATAPPAPESWDGMEPLVRRHVETRLDAVRSAPDDAGAWADLGRAYHANDLIDLAGPCYEHALELQGDDARTWYLLARVRSELGEIDGALLAVDDAIRFEPSAWFAHWRRGYWLLDGGRLDDAEAAFRTALEMRPRDPIATVGLARVAAERDDHAGAAGLLEPVVDVFGGADGVYVRGLLGAAYQRSGRSAEAGGLIARQPVTSVSWPDPWSDELYEQRRLSEWIVAQAHRMIQAGDPAAALSHLQPLIETYPDDPSVLKMIGQAAFASGDVDRAMTALRQVIAQQPDDFSANLNLGFAHERREEFAQAVPYAAKAAGLRPRDAAAQLQYARVLSKAGDHEAAAAVLERYAVLVPGDAQVDAARRELQTRREATE